MPGLLVTGSVAHYPRLMTARLQATGTPNPVLLRVSMDTGHGGGTRLSERDAQHVDVHSFLFMLLGVEYRPVAVGQGAP